MRMTGRYNFKGGFTLIEVIVSIFILSIIIVVSLSTFSFSNRLFNSLGNEIDSRANLKIASDFISEKIRNSGSIDITEGILTVDGAKVYIKNSILRFDTDSQQIAYGISTFNIEKDENTADTYILALTSGVTEVETIIRKGK